MKIKKQYKKIVEYKEKDMGMSLFFSSILFIFTLFVVHFYAFTDKILLETNPDLRAFFTGVIIGSVWIGYFSLWFIFLRSRRVYWEEIK